MGRTVLVAGAVALAAVAWLVLRDGGDLLRPDDAAVVARGGTIYAAQCASCHGANLEGQAEWRQRLANGRLPAPPHDPSGHSWHHADKDLFAMTKHGISAMVGDGYESDMPAYDGVLDDDDIVAVLSFIKASWPDDIRRRQDDLNRQAGR